MMMQVSVSLLQNIYDPLEDPPWDLPKQDIYPISNREIEICLDKRLKRPKQYNSLKPESRTKHIERIAWYIIHGWGDSYITLDFSQDCLIYDGFHRLSGAIYRGDDMIWADVYGNVEEIKTLY